jgi:hypothetical protein
LCVTVWGPLFSHNGSFSVFNGSILLGTQVCKELFKQEAVRSPSQFICCFQNNQQIIKMKIQL